MPLQTRDRTIASKIARELIVEISSEWKPTDDVYQIQKSGYYLFEFVIEPVRYAYIAFDPSTPDAFSPNTVVRFNPLADATEMVLAALDKTRVIHRLKSLTDEERDQLVRRDAKADILAMIKVAPDLFKDAVWQATLIGGSTRAVKQMIPTGRLDIARGIVNSTFAAIQNRLKKRLPKVSKAKSLKINQYAIGAALSKFYPLFKQTGALPSQRQFAIALNVTPKAWRTFLTKYDLDKHELTIKQWYEFMLREEANPQKDGDFPFST